MSGGGRKIDGEGERERKKETERQRGKSAEKINSREKVVKEDFHEKSLNYFSYLYEMLIQKYARLCTIKSLF